MSRISLALPQPVADLTRCHPYCLTQMPNFCNCIQLQLVKQAAKISTFERSDAHWMRNFTNWLRETGDAPDYFWKIITIKRKKYHTKSLECWILIKQFKWLFLKRNNHLYFCKKVSTWWLLTTMGVRFGWSKRFIFWYPSPSTK